MDKSSWAFVIIFNAGVMLGTGITTGNLYWVVTGISLFVTTVFGYVWLTKSE